MRDSAMSDSVERAKTLGRTGTHAKAPCESESLVTSSIRVSMVRSVASARRSEADEMHLQRVFGGERERSSGQLRPGMPRWVGFIAVFTLSAASAGCADATYSDDDAFVEAGANGGTDPDDPAAPNPSEPGGDD